MAVVCATAASPNGPSHETNNANNPSGGDPHHTFLKPQEVIARYRWGRTHGYLQLKNASFPRSIGGNYRLDTLIVWEEWFLTSKSPERDATVIAIPVVEPVTEQVAGPVDVPVLVDDSPAEFPQRRQSRRRAS